jgi:hypothetical protein
VKSFLEPSKQLVSTSMSYWLMVLFTLRMRFPMGTVLASVVSAPMRNCGKGWKRIRSARRRSWFNNSTVLLRIFSLGGILCMAREYPLCSLDVRVRINSIMSHAAFFL